MSEICVGIVTAYDPRRATISIRTQNGATFDDIPFDSSLGLYSTPVVSKLVTRPGGAIEVAKSGSFVLYSPITESNIRVLRLLNDDQALVASFERSSSRLSKGVVQDTLLYMVQEGETLITAPGKIYELSPNQYARTHGAWSLFKNSGDLILSNADTSAQVFLDRLGVLDIRSTSFTLAGQQARIYEDSAGALRMEAGPQRDVSSSLSLSTAGSATLSGGTASVTVDSTGVAVASKDFRVNIGGTLDLSAPQTTISTNTLTAAATSADISAPTSLVLRSNATVTILVGDNKITVSKSGILLQAAAGEQVTISNGAATYPVVYCKNLESTQITDVKELGISSSLSVGGQL